MDLPVALGQVIAGKYRIERVIGSGGMGIVVAGFHLELDQPVAIKFLTAERGLQIEAAERFRREARAAAKIHSEHVVRVFDIGLLDEHLPYLVMELLEGNDLEQEVEARGPLPVTEAVAYVLQAIDAIAEAHAVGIIHRDLKPTNLFLTTRADGIRIVKVLDFGISKTIIGQRDVALTKTAAFVGSPLYMSPEQMRSARDVDARTDIWALGAILYILLTAQLPYTATSLPEICLAVMNERPRPVTDLMREAPPDGLEALIFRCMEREREQRFASVGELAEQLVTFAPGMRPYAERAARVLSRSSGIPSITPRPDPFPANARGPLFTALADPRLPTKPSASSKPGATQASWDRTGGRTGLKERAPLILSGMLAVVLLLGVVGYFSMGRSGESPEAAVSAIPSVTTFRAPRVNAATPEMARPIAEATPNGGGDPAPAISSDVAPGSSVASALPADSAGLSGRAAVIQLRPPRARASFTPGSAPKTVASASGVTYFGGRR